VVVADLAAVAIPVAGIVALSIMTRFHPARAAVRWTSPVSIVPLIVAAHRVPIARYPGIAFTRTSRLNPNDAHRWRRANSHSDGKLSEDRSCCHQRQYN
jgi:hypothetical protein